MLNPVRRSPSAKRVVPPCCSPHALAAVAILDWRLDQLRLSSRTRQRQQLAPDIVPVFTSDGLNHYYYALTAHFGSWVQAAGERKRHWQIAGELLYGQVPKIVRR